MGGAVFHPAARAKEVLHFWREYAAGSPDALVIQGGSFTLPDGVRVFGIAACYCGRPSEGEKVLTPLRNLRIADRRRLWDHQLSATAEYV